MIIEFILLEGLFCSQCDMQVGCNVIHCNSLMKRLESEAREQEKIRVIALANMEKAFLSPSI